MRIAHNRQSGTVEFENGARGIAFSLEKDTIGVIVLGNYFTIKEGSIVKKAGRIASIPVGEGLLGRVINPLGEPIDGKGPIRFDGYRAIERIAPGIHERSDVNTPLQTGIKAIDSMIPLAGSARIDYRDRQPKTAIAIDTIINQRIRMFIVFMWQLVRKIDGSSNNRKTRRNGCDEAYDYYCRRRR